ncbi:AAA family ATPase, partial [Thermodesulfobacteriota bacterium]
MSISKQIKNIRSRIPLTMLQDRPILTRRLQEISDIRKKSAGSKRIAARLSSLEKRVKASMGEREGRLARRPEIKYPRNLPITVRRDDIVQAIQENQVVIISGETGSGKSTQIPKMCLEAGGGIVGKIGCTQPRRIAASTIARRIAEEIGEKLGQSVGYKIRFRDRSSPDAYIKIMTDGMLLAETQADPFLYAYDTLIIDEAHERSLNIDFLLGILRTLLEKRTELKVIITS